MNAPGFYACQKLNSFYFILNTQKKQGTYFRILISIEKQLPGKKPACLNLSSQIEASNPFFF